MYDMEFHEKIQELRKQKGLTQEQLAEKLYVSRTAVSKWESGRGYPNIDTLKQIARFFDITVDQLLSGEELLSVAERKQKHVCDVVFGLLDVSVGLFLILPLFGQRVGATVYALSLLHLTAVSAYMRIAYFSVVIGMVLWGVLTLALQNCQQSFWQRGKYVISLILNAIGVLLFVISPQPYAAAFLFVYLIIKCFLFFKKQ